MARRLDSGGSACLSFFSSSTRQAVLHPSYSVMWLHETAGNGMALWLHGLLGRYKKVVVFCLSSLLAPCKE